MSANADWRLLFETIIEAAEQIEDSTYGVDLETLVQDSVRADTVRHHLVTISDAARHVPHDVQARCREVDWRLMNDMQDVLNQDYPYIAQNLMIRYELRDVAAKLRKRLQEEGAAEP